MPDLCCCEYYDSHGERNHILACCCNCTQLDESFERLITCKSVPSDLKHSLFMSILDRLRIPWYGGAKQISTGLPLLYVPALLLLATINQTCTVISGMIGLLIFWVASKSAMMLPKFFILWMISSVGMIILVFEVLVIPWLYILPAENILAIALLVTSIMCIIKIHCEIRRLQEGISSDKNSYYCQFCQIYKNGGIVHKYWIDTCVTASTFKYYMIATISIASCMLYIANLHLTTICHPFRPFNSMDLLLPDDCSEVYESFYLTLPFVTGIYATVIGVLLLLEFIVNLVGLSFPCSSCCCAILKIFLLPFVCLCKLITCCRTGTKNIATKNIV